MKASATLVLVAGFLAASCLGSSQPVKRSPDRRYYTLHIPSSEAHLAVQAADALGVQYEGPVGELTTYYLVSTLDHEQLYKRDQAVAAATAAVHDPILEAFHAHKERRWLGKRDTENNDWWDRVHAMDAQVPRQRVKRAVLPEHHVKREPPFVEINQGKLTLEDAQETLGIQDPGFPRQWHLVNQENVGNDINVTGVWKQGITGEGSIVAILDDGLDYESHDLQDNFFAEGSYDFNDHVDLPKPKLFDDTHGTRCAGQIAAVKNDVCGIGIAYDAKVAGVRILSAEITDSDEAAALNYKYQENQIFSCSWGPPDNGETMEAPTGILAEAFVNGIKNGRDGKGSIYVFATGNGAISGDNCNFDGYTNSIYTITVGALDHTNSHPPYSESCSAQMVVAYSSGGGEFIYTTNVGENVCSDRHGGTSAAAPTAAGIFALVLSVRPELTWRDLQHLCVQTAIPVDLEDEDWKELPSGRKYNHKFGYGKLDAYAIVEAAKTFEHVNEQTYLELPVDVGGKIIPESTQVKKVPLKSTIKVTQDMVKNAGLKRLEHVTATVNIEHKRRGDIVITLQSPNNVESELATMRPGDKSPDGIRNWKFMSVKHWDEDPLGDWSLLVYDVTHPESNGTMLNWTLTLWGEMDPGFEGEPVHAPLAEHNTTVSDHHSTIVSSASATSTTTSEHVPARPTRLKSTTTATPATTATTTATTTTTTSSSTTTEEEEEEEEDTTTSTTTTTATAENDSTDTQTSTPESISPAADAAKQEDEDEDDSTSQSPGSGSTVVYALVGTGAIVALATGLYVQKRKSWQPPAGSETERHRQAASDYEFSVLRRSEEDEAEDDDITSDRHALLPDNDPSRRNRS